MPSRIHEILETFKTSKLMIVGDLILDHYAIGEVKRISPEAPIQILDVEKEEFRLGGAANVAKNLVDLHAKVTIVGVVGKDENGNIFNKILKESNIDNQGIFEDKERPTTVKTRLISGGHHLLRTDKEIKTPCREEIYSNMLQFIEDNIQKFDCIILSDYAKGVLTDTFTQKVVSIAQKAEKKVIVGPKGSCWKRYTGTYLVSANKIETEIITGIKLNTKENIGKAGKALLQRLNLNAALMTLGSKGMYLVSKDHNDIYIEAQANDVFDVTGAGDTVLSLISIAIAQGHSWKTALRLATAAAGIVVGKVGASTVTIQELEAKLSYGQTSHLEKIKNVEEVISLLKWEKDHGKVIILTHGCFDLLHPGHVRYLEYCKSRGDILIVAIYDDKLSKEVKGKNRPIMKEKDRAEILAGLSSCNFILSLSEKNTTPLLEKIKPDIFISTKEKELLFPIDQSKCNETIIDIYDNKKEFSTSRIIQTLNS